MASWPGSSPAWAKAATERVERLLPGLYFCWAVIFGSVLVWEVPPWQNPDEPAQVARAVQIALGELLGRRVGDIAGGTSDPAIMRSQAATASLKFHSDVRDSAVSEQAGEALRWGVPAMMWFPNTALYPPLLYAPMVPAVWIGRAGRMHVVATLRLMRLFDLIAAAGLGAGALAASRRTRPALLALLVLPMSISLAASASQDALLIPASCLAAALLDLARSRKQTPLRTRSLAVLAASVLATVLARPSNLPLAFTFLLLPASQRRAAVWLTGGVVGASLGWTCYALARISVPMSEADPGAQAHALLRDPGIFVWAMLASLRDWWGDYLDGMIGVLGWLDTRLPDPFYSVAGTVLLVAMLSAAGSEPERRWASRWLALTCAVSAGILALLALYLAWSPPGAGYVLGMQGRYLLPLLPAFALGLPDLGRWTAGMRPAAVAAVVLLAAVTPAVVVVALLRRYYLA
jgi:uncharacterized membrane protein